MDYKEKMLIEAICAGGKRGYSAIEAIYRDSFHSIENYIARNSGDKEEAKDIFQDGMIIFYRNIIAGQFKEQSSIKTYLFSICKNLWLQRLKHKGMGLVSLDEADDIPEQPIDGLNISLLDNLMEGLKDECQKILIGYYYQRKSMEELMVLFQLGSEQAARNKKMRCMKELMRIVSEKNMTLQSFWI